MDLKQIETFRAVAEELSFSRATARLGRVQSSVSAQIAGLEQELGVPLFDRLGRTIALTEPGVVMLAYSRKLLALAEETRDAVVDAGADSGELTGTIKASAPETLLTYRLPALLARFHQKYPNVRLTVGPSVVGRLAGETRRAVEEGRVDVAFVLDGPVTAPALVIEPLMREEVCVVAPASHALASRASVSAADIGGETMLLPEAPESGCAYRGQFEQHLRAAGVSPEKMEFQSIEAVKQCVAAGMGVSALLSVAVKVDLDARKLSALAWNQAFEVHTQMAWHRERWVSPALGAFLEEARVFFSEDRHEPAADGSQGA